MTEELGEVLIKSELAPKKVGEGLIGRIKNIDQEIEEAKRSLTLGFRKENGEGKAKYALMALAAITVVVLAGGGVKFFTDNRPNTPHIDVTSAALIPTVPGLLRVTPFSVLPTPDLSPASTVVVPAVTARPAETQAPLASATARPIGTPVAANPTAGSNYYEALPGCSPEKDGLNLTPMIAPVGQVLGRIPAGGRADRRVAEIAYPVNRTGLPISAKEPFANLQRVNFALDRVPNNENFYFIPGMQNVHFFVYCRQWSMVEALNQSLHIRSQIDGSSVGSNKPNLDEIPAFSIDFLAGTLTQNKSGYISADQALSLIELTKTEGGKTDPVKLQVKNK